MQNVKLDCLPLRLPMSILIVFDTFLYNNINVGYEGYQLPKCIENSEKNKTI